MKGTVILPKYLEKQWPPGPGRDFSNVLSVTAPFFYAIKDIFGFDLKYADEVDVPLNTDVVVMFGVPYHNRPNMIPGLLGLNKSTKLVMYPGDLQSYSNKTCMENRLKVYDRADFIISGSWEYFMKRYSQFAHKYEFMPLFFSPHDRYVNLPMNENPNMACLMSGSARNNIYPLRHFVKRNAQVVHKKSGYIGDSYAKLLHSYFCCVTSSSVFNYAVAKYFEIPAAGSLLIADEVEDVKMAGFIAKKHYVPITRDNAVKVIADCLKNPDR
jgi:hypothetical protein